MTEERTAISRIASGLLGNPRRPLVPILVHRTAEQQYRVWQLRPGVTSIGRDPSCDIVINETTISRIHAQIVTSTGQAIIEDLRSRNGTWVSGKRVVKCALTDGDGLIVGSNTLLYYRCVDPDEIAAYEVSGQFRMSTQPHHAQEPIIAELPEPSGVSLPFGDFDEEKTIVGPAIKIVTAKVVLLGESNAGKSCLAQRVAHGTFPDPQHMRSTHGMRFWSVWVDDQASNKSNTARQIALWDMGGQTEYKVVHQIFLHDTVVALILFDPTRGPEALIDAAAWSRRIDKQVGGERTKKILVGAKMDDPRSVVDVDAIQRFAKEHGFVTYVSTSALTGRGVDKLFHDVAGYIDWAQIEFNTAPVVFMATRDVLDKHRQDGEAAVAYATVVKEATETIAAKQRLPITSDISISQAIDDAIRQLAAQGEIVNTNLQTGDKLIILNVTMLEKYAASIVLAARGNRNGAPAVEPTTLGCDGLPGLEPCERFNPVEEQLILQCATTLLILHGVCFRHQGLLVFPSLFRPIGARPLQGPSRTDTVFFEVQGPTENIYASLVTALAASRVFGVVRLWADGAEFEDDNSVCAIRRGDEADGLTHFDILFGEQSSVATKRDFKEFVRSHLKSFNLKTSETITAHCPHCAHVFNAEVLRLRIKDGRSDIGCEKCDTRTRIDLVDFDDHHPGGQGVSVLWERAQQIIGISSRASARRPQAPIGQAQPTARLLYLSDLHLDPNTNPGVLAAPLINDLEALGGGHVDYLVISGDFTNTASRGEFDVAREFVSRLISDLQIDAQRCILIPGNHDLSWDVTVYAWQPKRRVDPGAKADGSCIPMGDGYLVRDDDMYQRRFDNFSNYLYHPIKQTQYPTSFEEQADVLTFERHGLQVIGFNSSWQIDEHKKDRSGINLGSVMNAISRANETWTQRGAIISPLRIAVWHHPVTGSEQMRDTSFLEHLRAAGVRMVLHGHVHHERPDVVYSPHNSLIHIVGAGSFGAPANARPEATPRMYNVIDIGLRSGRVRVHTRARRRSEGAWNAWSVWPSRHGANTMQGWYEFDVGTIV